MIRLLKSKNVCLSNLAQGKLKPKKLEGLLNSLSDRDLGPYGKGMYTSPRGTTIDLVHIPCSDLSPEVNSNKVICGKVVCSVESNSTVPL